MKEKLILVAAVAWCAGALGQGTVVFNNLVRGTVITHVYAPLPSDPTFRQFGNGPADTPTGTVDWSAFAPVGATGINGPYGAATTFAQLLSSEGFDQPESSLQPAVPITTFRTGIAAGCVVGVEATLQNVPWDFPATVQMVAWDNNSGLYPTWTEASVAWESGVIAAGKSARMNLHLGTPTQPSQNLIGLESFNLYFVPEPSTLAQAVTGFLVLILGRLTRLRGWR